MANLIKSLVFILVSGALLVDLGFIIWATKSNFLIVLPAVLSAFYLVYLAAYYTILTADEEDKPNNLGVGVQEARTGVREVGGESATGEMQPPVKPNGGGVAYPRADVRVQG